MLPADRKENKNSVEDTVSMQEVLAFVPSTTTSALVLVMSQQESLMDIDSLTYQKWGKVLQATGKNTIKTVVSKLEVSAFVSNKSTSVCSVPVARDGYRPSS